MMSDTICIAALAYQTGPTGRQCLLRHGKGPPDQNALTGVQNAKPLITIHSPEIMRNAIRV